VDGQLQIPQPITPVDIHLIKDLENIETKNYDNLFLVNFKTKFKEDLDNAEVFYSKIKKDLCYDFDLLKKLVIDLKAQDVII
jgi:hypothetical protein